MAHSIRVYEIFSQKTMTVKLLCSAGGILIYLLKVPSFSASSILCLNLWHCILFEAPFLFGTTSTSIHITRCFVLSLKWRKIPFWWFRLSKSKLWANVKYNIFWWHINAEAHGWIKYSWRKVTFIILYYRLWTALDFWTVHYTRELIIIIW